MQLASGFDDRAYHAVVLTDEAPQKWGAFSVYCACLPRHDRKFRGHNLARDHSRLIVILLAGIFAVLLFGREVVFGSLQTAFWVGLALGAVALIIWAVVSLIRYTGKEAKAYRAEVQKDREEGRPWLHTYIAWPGILGNFAVFAFAGYKRFILESCRVLTGDCLETIPYWWFPVTLLLGSILIAGLERIVLHFRRART
jgi:hypothetical protein